VRLIIDLDARFSTSQDAPQDPGLGLNDIPMCLQGCDKRDEDVLECPADDKEHFGQTGKAGPRMFV
jgi:hypothetical protein